MTHSFAFPGAGHGLPDRDADPQFYEGVPARRAFAFVIDFVLICLLSLVAIVVAGVATLGVAFLFAWFIFTGVGFLYRFWSLAYHGSATPGMKLTGIEIRNGAGERLSPSEAALHTLLFCISISFFLPHLVSILMMATTRSGAGLHDLPIGSTAINRPA